MKSVTQIKYRHFPQMKHRPNQSLSSPVFYFLHMGRKIKWLLEEGDHRTRKTRISCVSGLLRVPILPSGLNSGKSILRRINDQCIIYGVTEEKRDIPEANGRTMDILKLKLLWVTGERSMVQQEAELTHQHPGKCPTARTAQAHLPWLSWLPLQLWSFPW